MLPSFRPRLVETLRGYTRAEFGRDASAGITVGIIALPLALAFGISSVNDPAAGLYTAIVAGFLISALGGTRVSIGGPTGAFIGVVYAVHAQHGLANLAVCTILAGLMLLVMGWARLGAMINYIPYPVTGGFTAGIAVIISGAHAQPLMAMGQAGLIERWGPENFCEHYDAALARAREILAGAQ